MEKKKESTLRCVGVLVVIALICGLLLAILNPLLYVAPSVKDIANKFNAEGIDVSNDWQIEENVNEELSKGKKSSILLVAKLTDATTNKEYIGMSIQANADGKMGACTFAIFFDLQTNKLIQASYIKNGATDGYQYDDVTTAEGFADKNPGINTDFSEYFVEITSADVFSAYPIPVKTGATKTVSAVHNVFDLAAKYYFNVYAKNQEVA